MDILGSFNFLENPTLNDVPLSGGTVLQVVTGIIPAASGTTTVPLDNTTPLITEGWQFFSETFTPISSTSKIIVQYSITYSNATNTATVIASVFSGTTNIGSIANSIGSTRAGNLSQYVVFSPGSINTITITGRIGAQSGTVYVNTITGTTLGGATVSKYIITEVE